MEMTYNCVFVVNRDLWIVIVDWFFFFWTAVKAVKWRQQHRFSFQARMCICADVIGGSAVATLNKRMGHWYIIGEKLKEKKNQQKGKSTDLSVFSCCESLDKLGQKRKRVCSDGYSLEPIGLILFQHVSLKRALRHFGCHYLPDKVSHLYNTAMKKSLWLDRKSKSIASTWTQLHYVMPFFTSINPNVTVCNGHNCLLQLSSTAIKTLT